MKFSLPELAIQRPITVSMLIVSVLGLGFIAQQRIPIEFLPRFDVPFVGVYIPYPGATPEQVQNEVAIPAEGEFRTISQVDSITTTSNQNGCDVRLIFGLDADMTTATAEVRDRMERLKLKLPTDVDRIFLQRFSTGTMPILALSVFRDDDPEELAHFIRTRLEPRLRRIDGVADVQTFSQDPREVLVEFDQNKLRAANLSLYGVVEDLRRSSLNVSVGRLLDGETQHFVRAQGEFDHPDQLANLIVGPPAVRLRDVADVGYKKRELVQDFSIDGKSGAFMLVRKESEANTVATCEQVLAELATLPEDPAFAGLDTLTFFNQGELIMATLNSLLKAGQYGATLALIVLLLFLQRIRPTLIVALAIPASLVVALVVMFMSGMSLNLVTMIAMIVAVGMLVDNSIVVIENIYRHQQMGYEPREAAVQGATKVGMAIIASTTTTMVVFIPTFYLEAGEMARYMRQFSVPVTVALGASLLIALTVIPLAASRMRPRNEMWLYKKIAARLPERERFISNKAGLIYTLRQVRLIRPILPLLTPLRSTISGYGRLLSLTISWRIAAIMIVGGVTAYTFYGPARQLGIQQMPTVDTREVGIEVRMDQNFDMARARETMDLITDAVEEMREELGIKNIWRRFSARNGRINAYLYPANEIEDGMPNIPTEDVMNIIWQRLPDRMPGVELRFSIPDAGEGQSRSITLNMRGDDLAVLESSAENFRRVLAQLEGISQVVLGLDQSAQEIQLRIDESLSKQAGVSPIVVAQTVDFALRGTRLPFLKSEGREVPVWAQFREEDRRDRSNLENVAVQTGTGNLMPLKQLVTMRRADSPQAITRINGKNVVSITAQTSVDDVGRLLQQVRLLVNSFDLPLGYEIMLGDDLRELDSNITNFFTAALLACALIYIVMGALFESYLLPLSIISSVWLASLGVVWAMFLTGTSLDTIAFIGIILMLGIVVNNAIVIVDHINQLRNEGLNRHDAIVQAGQDRFRPVMMTAITTILGVLPLAIGGDMGADVSFKSMGWALVGGLTSGTFLTLFIVPLFYTMIDDVREFTTDYFGSLASLFNRGAPTDPSTPDFIAK